MKPFQRSQIHEGRVRPSVQRTVSAVGDGPGDLKPLPCKVIFWSLRPGAGIRSFQHCCCSLEAGEHRLGNLLRERLLKHIVAGAKAVNGEQWPYCRSAATVAGTAFRSRSSPGIHRRVPHQKTSKYLGATLVFCLRCLMLLQVELAKSCATRAQVPIFRRFGTNAIVKGKAFSFR